jgi:hypothetical protein
LLHLVLEVVFDFENFYSIVGLMNQEIFNSSQVLVEGVFNEKSLIATTIPFWECEFLVSLASPGIRFSPCLGTHTSSKTFPLAESIGDPLMATLSSPLLIQNIRQPLVVGDIPLGSGLSSQLDVENKENKKVLWSHSFIGLSTKKRDPCGFRPRKSKPIPVSSFLGDHGHSSHEAI